MDNFINAWMSMTDQQRLHLSEDQIKYFSNENFLKRLKDKINGSQKKLYTYLITFTLDLNKNDLSDKLISDVTKYIKDQAKRAVLKILYYAFNQEVTKAGTAHWHAVVVTEKSLSKNRFQYYTQKYGYIDISRTKVTTHHEALNYISKDSSPEVLLDKISG